MILLELFWRFALISVLAFGGGGAALPLVERTVVAETGWVNPRDFATALALTYITPGPVLILATFVGYRTAGLPGGLAATLGAFLIPWILATLAAQQIKRYTDHPWLRGFGWGAGPAVIGLLLVTAFGVAQSAFTAWPYPVIALVALVLSLWRKVHVFFVLVASAAAGGVIGALVAAGVI